MLPRLLPHDALHCRPVFTFILLLVPHFKERLFQLKHGHDVEAEIGTSYECS